MAQYSYWQTKRELSHTKQLDESATFLEKLVLKLELCAFSPS